MKKSVCVLICFKLFTSNTVSCYTKAEPSSLVRLRHTLAHYTWSLSCDALAISDSHLQLTSKMAISVGGATQSNPIADQHMQS